MVVYARHAQDLASQRSSTWRIGSHGLLHLVEKKLTVNGFWEKEESVVFNGVAPGRSRHYSSCPSYPEYKGRAHWNQWNACNKIKVLEVTLDSERGVYLERVRRVTGV